MNKERRFFPFNLYFIVDNEFKMNLKWLLFGYLQEVPQNTNENEYLLIKYICLTIEIFYKKEKYNTLVKTATKRKPDAITHTSYGPVWLSL